MDFIVVRVSDLYEKVKLLKDDNMQYVKLLILDSDDMEGDVLPPAVTFTAIKDANDLSSIDYEDIEAVEDVYI